MRLKPKALLAKQQQKNGYRAHQLIDATYGFIPSFITHETQNPAASHISRLPRGNERE
jgi:hypothetical protein